MYFAIDRFPAYGRLSRLDTREIKAGARVAQDDYTKENAQDFALWKAAKPEDEATGRRVGFAVGTRPPRLAPRVLGDGDGSARRDARHPLRRRRPRSSRITRTRSRSPRRRPGKPFSRVWCHGAFLLTDGAKMAKRVGNVSTVQDLREEGVSAAALRHFVFITHYRKELNLSDEALEASMEAVRRVGEFADRLDDGDGRHAGAGGGGGRGGSGGARRRCSTT